MTTTRNTKRKDKARVVLRKGESQRKDGKYDFRWTSPMVNDILFTRQVWKNFGKRKKAFT